MLTQITKTITGIFGKSGPKKTYAKADYYGQIYAPKTFKEFERILTVSGKKVVVSEEEISFNKLPFGSNKKEAEKRLGKPYYRINNGKNIQGHEIVFFRIMLGHHKVTAQLHFLDQQFFLGQYFFNEFRIDRFAEVKAMLSRKYLGDQTATISQISISDDQNNRIEIGENSFGLVQYISGDKAFLQNLRMQQHLIEELAMQVENAKFKTVYASL